MAFVIFCIVKAMNAFRRKKEEAETKELFAFYEQSLF